MQNAALEKLVWVFIYAGMVVFGLGVWFVEHSLALGSSLLVAGSLSMVLGAILIWWRSRRS